MSAAARFGLGGASTLLLPLVRLKTLRNSRHPWIFRKMVREPRGAGLEPGSLVEVRDRSEAFVGLAFYHPANTVALRLLTEDPNETVDRDFLLRRLTKAKSLRERTLALGGSDDSFRLVNAEADGLPGLVIDKYAGVMLMEPYIAGWLHLMDWLAEAAAAVCPGCRPVVRAAPGAAEREGVSFAAAEAGRPPPEGAVISENGIRYRVDFASGRKTGFFLDQRENRARTAALARGLDVLDLCSYTGGFALSAWKGGARRVEAVDLDEKALETAAENLELNQAGEGVVLTRGNAFDVCRRHLSAGLRHDLVVLDPPKLASGPEEAAKALDSYRDLNLAALRLVRPGGVFATFSCSGAVPEDRWRRAVGRAAEAAGAELVVFHAGGAGPDHPVSSLFPQGRYLKSMFARVDMPLSGDRPRPAPESRPPLPVQAGIQPKTGRGRPGLRRS